MQEEAERLVLAAEEQTAAAMESAASARREAASLRLRLHHEKAKFGRERVNTVPVLFFTTHVEFLCHKVHAF